MFSCTNILCMDVVSKELVLPSPYLCFSDCQGYIQLRHGSCSKCFTISTFGVPKRIIAANKAKLYLEACECARVSCFVSRVSCLKCTYLTANILVGSNHRCCSTASVCPRQPKGVTCQRMISPNSSLALRHRHSPTRSLETLPVSHTVQSHGITLAP